MSETMPNENKVPVPPTVVVVNKTGTGPGCIVQGLWFLFVGWWLGGLAIALAWILNITILGLPLGMAILNNVPKLLALQSGEKTIQAITKDGVTTITEVAPKQLNFLVRAIFFALIGWWWSGVWLAIGYLLCVTILLMPVGLQMFRLTPMMTTLRRY